MSERPELTILCITLGRKYGEPFIEEMGAVARRLKFNLVLCVEGDPEWTPPSNAAVHDLRSGEECMETIVNTANGLCPDGYILRLDDDEAMSLEMQTWLRRGDYLQHDHWAFPRFNLYGDAHHYITNPPLWPDLQTRLSIKEKSGRPPVPHVGSPFGTGEIAPCAIEHHKFLIRDYEERESLIAKYDAYQPGAGTNYAMFSIPDHPKWRDQLKVALTPEGVLEPVAA